MTVKTKAFTKNNMIWKNNDKSGISLHFKHNNDLFKDTDQIYNTYGYFFTNVGPNHATAIPQSNLHNIFRNALNIITNVIVCS